MPTYEYKCEDCGHRFEQFESITAEPRTDCPSCEGRVKRLIGPGAGFLFKGSGFYITDYRSEGYKAGAKADKAAESGGSNTGGCGGGTCGKGECAA